MNFYDVFGNKTEMSYFLPSSNIVEYVIDQENDNMFVFSNVSSKGNEAIVIHFFKFFNVLAWENLVNLNVEYPFLDEFRLRTFNSVSYDGKLKKGSMISKSVYDNSTGYNNVSVVIFKIDGNNR